MGLKPLRPARASDCTCVHVPFGGRLCPPEGRRPSAMLRQSGAGSWARSLALPAAAAGVTSGVCGFVQAASVRPPASTTASGARQLDEQWVGQTEEYQRLAENYLADKKQLQV